MLFLEDQYRWNVPGCFSLFRWQLEYFLLKPCWILSRKLIITSFYSSCLLKASEGVVSLQLLRRCLSSIQHARLVAPQYSSPKLIDKHLAVDVFRSDSFGELVLIVTICVTPSANLYQGLMFCIGVPMGWSTLNTTNHLPYDVLTPVYVGGCFWVWTYETIYQHMVRKNLYSKSKKVINLL